MFCRQFDMPLLLPLLLSCQTHWPLNSFAAAQRKNTFQLIRTRQRRRERASADAFVIGGDVIDLCSLAWHLEFRTLKEPNMWLLGTLSLSASIGRIRIQTFYYKHMMGRRREGRPQTMCAGGGGQTVTSISSIRTKMGCKIGLVVSMSASHLWGSGFKSWLFTVCEVCMLEPYLPDFSPGAWASSKTCMLSSLKTVNCLSVWMWREVVCL